ncbi:hypothetical protein ACJX0J_001771 [Zea mays]
MLTQGKITNLAGLFVCLVRKEEDLMIIRSSEPEVKIAVDRDPIKTSFEEWARPGHFSRTIAKGPDTTTWIWNLHADAHDFDSHTGDLEEISRKVLWHVLPRDPTHIGPSAQAGVSEGSKITSGFFQIWRASGITSELQLYCTAIGALIFASLMLFAGWFHYHKAAPKLAWFQDGIIRTWIPLPHEFILNRDLLAQLYPSFAEGATPFFHLELVQICGISSFRGGLDPITGGLWLSDIAHHHLAIAILFLIAGHMYRTNWGIGHGT